MDKLIITNLVLKVTMSNEWVTVSYKKKRKPKSKDDGSGNTGNSGNTSVTHSTTYGQSDVAYFKPTILKKKTPHVSGGKHYTSTESDRLRKLEEAVDEGTYRTETVSRDLKMQIQQARNKKGMSQKTLATKANLQLAVVKNYENGTATPNQQDLRKMSKALGVVLSKGKKKKPKK